MRPDLLRAHAAADLFPMLPEKDLAALAADIREHGQREPIRLFNGHVLDGRNRLAACKLAGVEPRVEEWRGSEREAWEFVWSENFHRRHLEKGQAVAIRMLFDEGVAKLTETVKAEAKEKQREAGGDRRSAAARPVVAPVPQAKAPIAPKTRDTIAAKVNASPRTVQDALSLKAKAPAKFQDVADGKTSLKQAMSEVKLEAKHALAAEIRREPAPLPAVGPFRVIAIDPPWKYESRIEDHTHRGRNQYPDMTVEEICALPVREMAMDDCVLWLWTTNAFMREAFQCLDAWGFTPKTILTWDKVNLGLGDWLRNVTEHCILATRGRPLVTLTNQTTIIRETRREHSRKPDAFYSLVASLCPGSKLEMFARASREGWATWGAEREKFDAAE